MDSAGKPEKKIEDAVKDLKLYIPTSSCDVNMSGPKDASQSDATSCISSGDVTSSIKESEFDHESVIGGQGMYYYGCYYPGSNGLFGEWDAQNHAMTRDGVEMQPPVIQADNGSVLYYFPGFHAGYSPCSPLLPGAVIGFDGQYLAQQINYPSPISMQSPISPGICPQMIAYGQELLPVYPWDPSLFLQDGLQASMLSLDPLGTRSNSNLSSKSLKFTPSKTLQASKAKAEVKGSSPASVVAETPAIQNQSNKFMRKAAAATVVADGYTLTNKFPSSPDQGKGGLLHTSSAVNMKENSRSWVGTEKLKARNKLSGFDFDLLSEQNRGPRTNGTKGAVECEGINPTESLTLENNDNSNELVVTKVNRDQYNLPDFPTKYEHALFFVIKSYSEDDIHKSIKYDVWASTPNGNKRLDNAFHSAQEKMAETGSKCPIFLFFSVNASGQFCGVAEMTGRVDFSKNMDFWQQDKWNGFFSVKWHIIKDIPNPQLRHIILENNENKPVTNSRDTQEVKFPQGTEMLNIFKNYSSKTCILDDFSFYENRQRAMQSKRNKSLAPSLVQSPKINELIQGPNASDPRSEPSVHRAVDLSSVKTKEEPQIVV